MTTERWLRIAGRRRPFQLDHRLGRETMTVHASGIMPFTVRSEAEARTVLRRVYQTLDAVTKGATS
jgi:hypothetical protein